MNAPPIIGQPLQDGATETDSDTRFQFRSALGIAPVGSHVCQLPKTSPRP